MSLILTRTQTGVLTSLNNYLRNGFHNNKVEGLRFYFNSVAACSKMLAQNILKHNHSDMIFPVDCLFESKLQFSMF
jgi:hypothetical protein